MKTRLVRLQTGEEILANVEYSSNDIVILKDPFVAIQHPQNPQQMVFLPWAPLVSNRQIEVNRNHVTYEADVDARLSKHHADLLAQTNAAASGLVLPGAPSPEVEKEIKRGSKIIQP